MATNEQGILGGFSGKVGTVIGGNWNGVGFMKGIPAKIVNPQSEKQQNQRAKIAITIKFLSPLKSFLRVGFKKQAIKMSAFNAATSYNMARAVTGVYPDFAIDYSKVLVSQGNLPGALNPGISSPAKGKVEFTWQDNSSKISAMPNDKAVLLVVHPEKGKVFTTIGGNIRTSGSQVISLPQDFTEGEVQCYLSFQNANQTVISDSVWVGELML